LFEFNFKEESKVSSEPDKELTDVAAEAMSLQPTGHTLATTQVRGITMHNRLCREV